MAYDWAAGLGGLGAALQGNLPEWQVAETDRKNRLAELDEKRLKAMAMDFDASLSDLNAGNVGSAWERLVNRHEQIIKLGGDPTHTENLMKMFKEGRIDEAKAKLTQSRQAAIQDGFIEGDKYLGKEGNMAIYQGSNGTYARPIAGLPEESKLVNPYVDEQGNLRSWNGTEMAVVPTPDGAKFKGSGTTVNVNNTPEGAGLTEEQKQLAKDRAGFYSELRNQATAAMEQNNQLSVLENVDIETGFGVEGRKSFAKVANFMFGEGAGDVFLENVPAVEAFQALADKIVNSRVSLEKGPQTNEDVERFRRTMVSLGKTPEANKFILLAMKETNNRIIEQKRFYQSILKEKGTLAGADELWMQYKLDTPLFSSVVQNKETGLPMFFSEFEKQAKKANRNATREQILEAWREIND